MKTKKITIWFVVTAAAVLATGCHETMMRKNQRLLASYPSEMISEESSTYQEDVNGINKLALRIQEIKESGSGDEKKAISDGRHPEYQMFLGMVRENQKKKQAIIKDVLTSEYAVDPSDVWMENNQNLIYAQYKDFLIQIHTFFIGQIRVRMANEARLGRDFNLEGVAPGEKSFRKMEWLSRNIALPFSSADSGENEMYLRMTYVLQEAYDYREVWILGAPWQTTRAMIQVADLPIYEVMKLQARSSGNPLVVMLEVKDSKVSKKVAGTSETPETQTTEEVAEETEAEKEDAVAENAWEKLFLVSKK